MIKICDAFAGTHIIEFDYLNENMYFTRLLIDDEDNSRDLKIYIILINNRLSELLYESIGEGISQAV